MENIQGTRWAVEHHNFVPNIAWNAIQVAGPDDFLFVTDGEASAAFQPKSHLLVRVGVLWDDGTGFDSDVARSM